jgi:hypothetical protein
VDLDRLEPAGWRALMSWFSGSSRTNGTSRSRSNTSGSRSSGRSGSRSRRAQTSPGQLSLDLGISLEP